MKKIVIYLTLAAALTAACGQRTDHAPHDDDSQAVSLQQSLPGDSAIYGLACDGCTDSVLVFLPYKGGDPDTFDIIEARQQHRIYGRPHIGDELAVMLNPADSDEVRMLVNAEMLKGTWCYQVQPRLRHIGDMPKRMQRRMLERIPDSVRQRWMQPREYTLRLKRDNSASHYGTLHRQTTTDDMSPVQYPVVTHYTEWRLYNGRLILKADTIAGFSAKGDTPRIDTADIKLLRKDSLVLRFADHDLSLYKKKSS